MIRFEVTGATPEEFAENAMKAWGLVAIGLQQALSAQPAPPVQISEAGTPSPSMETNGSESSSTASKEPTEEEVDFAMEMQRRGAVIQEKIEGRKKVHSDKVDDLFVEEPSAKPTKTAKNSSKGPKLDDLKTRLSEVIVAATERWDQKRANAYARSLLRGFGIEKLSELKAEQYEKFLEISGAYVDGVVAE